MNLLKGEAATGEMICTNQDIAKVSFTGSLPTGMKVQKACAEPKRIKPVSFYLFSSRIYTKISQL